MCRYAALFAALFAILLPVCCQIAAAQEPVQVTADELVLALCHNHAAFDMRYAQRRLIVAGVVSSIRRSADVEGAYVLAMRRDSRDCTGVVLFLFKEELQALAALSPPHQQVTIEATMVENVFGEKAGVADVVIRFDECSIVRAEPLTLEPAP
jgi:hypothetical protein